MPFMAVISRVRIENEREHASIARIELLELRRMVRPAGDVSAVFSQPRAMMEAALPTPIGRPAFSRAASSEAPSRLSCRCNRR